MIKAIIFDCFGVLVGSGFKDTYAQAGGDPVRDKDFIDDVLTRANMGLITSNDMNQEITERLGISAEAWRLAVNTSDQVKQVLFEYIKSLKPKYKVAILSNANTGTLQRKFTTQQLDLFDAVVVSAEVGMIKPNTEIYTYTAKKLDVNLEECLFTDDSKTYCAAANKLGMKTICYNNFKQFKHECEQILSQL